MRASIRPPGATAAGAHFVAHLFTEGGGSAGGRAADVLMVAREASHSYRLAVTCPVMPMYPARSSAYLHSFSARTNCEGPSIRMPLLAERSRHHAIRGNSPRSSLATHRRSPANGPRRVRLRECYGCALFALFAQSAGTRGLAMGTRRTTIAGRYAEDEPLLRAARPLLAASHSANSANCVACGPRVPSPSNATCGPYGSAGTASSTSCRNLGFPRTSTDKDGRGGVARQHHLPAGTTRPAARW